jgi:hypothetical protein
MHLLCFALVENFGAKSRQLCLLFASLNVLSPVVTPLNSCCSNIFFMEELTTLAEPRHEEEVVLSPP